MEEAPGPGPDFSHLPSDALLHVFEHVLRSDTGGGLPLSEFFVRWQALQLTCKHWCEVLLAHPPPLSLDISTLPEPWLLWLLSLPVQSLRIEEGLDAPWSQAAGGGGGPPAGMPSPLAAAAVVSGLEGAGGPQPFWSLAALPQLQRVHLQAPVSSTEAPAVFDSSALQSLERLAQLSLGSFAEFELSHLPTSLRRLRLCYDTQNRALSVPQLPDHISLELLQVVKQGSLGAVGICIDDFWGRVAALDITASQLLLGVPVEDRRLIATFERPYREGNFVPPHIWGDEEADDNSKQAADMTANHLLSCLPSCPRLERLAVGGAAAASIKFMPVLPHKVASLQWLWSVVWVQGLHNLLGFSGQELEARQQLFAGGLRFSRPRQPHAGAPEACCIQVVRRNEPAGPEAE